MNELRDNRLIRTFTKLRAAGEKALVPFITAGYPDTQATEALLKDFESRGVRVCELGIPFSDPIADGPTVRRFRAGGGWMALVAMVSYSIVYRHGVERYLAGAAEAGFDGVIIPDLPLDEASALEPLALARGLANVMLIAPNTPPARRLEIARHSRGFIYFISVAGITGERDKLPDETIAAVAELRRDTEQAVCVGFGISSPQMVRRVCQAADGAIVGSAIVHRISDAKAQPRDRLVEAVGGFVGELLTGLSGFVGELLTGLR